MNWSDADMAISAKEAIERVERQQRRIKRQNEHIKENYDRVSVTLPKGTKERIKVKGETVNGFITRLVLSALESDAAEEERERAPFE